MKKIILFLSLFPVLCLGNIPTSKIENFNGSYLDPSGTASADYFEFNQYQFGANAEFTVEKQAGSIFLETPDESIQFDNIPDFITNLSELEWKNLNLNTNSSSIDFSLKSLKGSHTEGAVKINNLSLECKNKNATSTSDNEILEMCLNQFAEVSLASTKITDKDKDTDVSNLSISIDKNDMKYKVKYGSFTVKGHGQTFYETNLIRIKISTAKVGILNVRGKLFNELSKNQTEDLTVNEPWIEIRLKE